MFAFQASVGVDFTRKERQALAAHDFLLEDQNVVSFMSLIR